MNLLFAGMKHCGKSTHGRFVANHLACPFYDTDDLILLEHFRRTGRRMTIRSFFCENGQNAFHRAEAESFLSLADMLSSCEGKAGAGGHSVVSLGGQLPCNPLLQDRLGGVGVCVFLRVDPLVLYERVQAGGHFPFIAKDNPREDFLRLYATRLPYYERHADLTVDLDDRPKEEAASLVITKVQEFIHGR